MSDEWKPCPFCGYPIEVDNPRYGSFIHPSNKDCILSEQFLWPEDKPVWNTRTPVSVQEAAKVLLNDRAAFDRMVDAAAEDIHGTGVSFNRVVGDALRAIAEGGEA